MRPQEAVGAPTGVRLLPAHSSDALGMTLVSFVTQVVRSRLLVLFREIPMRAFWHVLLFHSVQLPFQYNMIYTRKPLAVQPFSLLSCSL